jgi:alpha-L-rhamnosidase
VYQLDHGATTLTEAWDVSQASQNHLMIGHGEAWLFRGLAGIQNDTSDGAVAFRKIIIRPQVPADLKAAEEGGAATAHVRFVSPRGPIVSRWSRQGKVFTLAVTIPPTSTATVYVPAAEPGKVTSTPAGSTPRVEEKMAVFTLGPGAYTFNSTLP